MNLYFLVEGKTEKKIYPKWLELLLPDYSRVNAPHDAVNHNYFLISGGGYPSLLDNHLADSIADVDDCGNYDYLVICLDCDYRTPQETVAEVEDFIKEKGLVINSPCQLKVIPQHKTIETWCLGNKKVYPRSNLSPAFRLFADFYDVSVDNAEKMSKPKEDIGTIGNYHFNYLSTMLREKNISYSKTNPIAVTEKTYLQQLKKRTQTTSHLATLNYFFEFCTHISPHSTSAL